MKSDPIPRGLSAPTIGPQPGPFPGGLGPEIDRHPIQGSRSLMVTMGGEGAEICQVLHPVPERN